jgi:hypothetical protein
MVEKNLAMLGVLSNVTFISRYRPISLLEQVLLTGELSAANDWISAEVPVHSDRAGTLLIAPLPPVDLNH